MSTASNKDDDSDAEADELMEAQLQTDKAALLVDVDLNKPNDQQQQQQQQHDAGAHGLAYTQVQLAVMSIFTIGLYSLMMEWRVISQHGLFVNFSTGAVVAIFMSATGGLIVASVLKYADSILKGYATALSVILTGLLSMMLFGTHLSGMYFLGIVFVVGAVILYNGQEAWWLQFQSYLGRCNL